MSSEFETKVQKSLEKSGLLRDLKTKLRAEIFKIHLNENNAETYVSA